MTPDPLVTDPAAGSRSPATTPAITFTSGGETLIGVLHVPAGPGPHPVVLLLHGFPGMERNFDVAQALRRLGYATLVFHYRGSWGMGGSWSWRHVLEDSAAAVAALREPGFAAAHRLDPARLVVAGHSTGGFAALMTAAADPSIVAAGSWAGFDFGTIGAAVREDPDKRAAYVRAFDEELLPLRGTSGEALVAEMEEAGEEWRLARLAPRLDGRPVLLIGTSRDAVTAHTIHHEPLAAAFRARPSGALEEQVFATDHALSDHRVALTRALVSFLDEHVGAER
ncbi:alpha/beta fold hydrolase [Nonomuraea sp. SMC257]|uniref:Alpha/beta fold hydrolase n=1 Tax=Nonomuraea montanisoli TaxID=2741721 RepID=A0A7Y6I7I0_9ACTN|nr:alpha/beta fold hydrolase [Nonomuraea montanisoli]NUW32996.1 alpha/beta fold hydrolase [Nonomuraea montanisoli]